MRKQERRALICLVLALALLAGIGLFGYRFVKDGGRWATFYGNTQIYTDGVINRGTITDRYGEELLQCTPDGFFYSGDCFRPRLFLCTCRQAYGTGIPLSQGVF